MFGFFRKSGPPVQRNFVRSLTNLLGFRPGNAALYRLAFSHRSLAGEPGKPFTSNERLEYLGDAILGAVIADHLFRTYPFKEEGFLTEMRSRIVSRDQLNRLAIKLGIAELMLENLDRSQRTKSVYGNAFEALIGAIYLDKGYECARRFIVERILRHHIDLDAIEQTETNFKSRLIEWGQKEKKNISFEVVEGDVTGGKLIKVRAFIDGEPGGTGVDFSKKKAEQLAAEDACRILNI